MKKHFSIPSVLLIGYAIFSATTNTNIAHSIILFSLAGLYAYNQFLLAHENPSHSTELAKLKEELEQQIEKQKELHETKLMQLEDELTKMSLITPTRSSSSSSKADAAKKFQF